MVSCYVQFMQNKVFPADIQKQLMATLHNPGASSCAEDGLMRVLRKYDPKARRTNVSGGNTSTAII